LNQKTNTGWTALHLAIRSGDLEMVDLLLGYGASAHVPLPKGKTPLIYAVELDETRIAESLVAMGSLDTSVEKEHGIDARDSGGNSALLLAVQNRNSELAVSLLYSGADPNVRNHNRQTPLHLAIMYGDLAVAGMLMEHGASLLTNGPAGVNAIVAARKRGFAPMIKLLASYLPEIEVQSIP